MGRTATTPLKDVLEIVRTRGRVYVARGKYVQVHVFSTFRSEVYALAYAYGGRIYKHRTGYVWLLATRTDLEALAEILIECGGSVNRIEDKILTYYPDNKKGLE